MTDTWLQRPAVLASSEFLRINALPRRVWDFEGPEATALAVRMTELLRTPGGTRTLKPVQAVALFEFWRVRGLVGSMGVGAGKTDTLFLLPGISEAKRPGLLVPAKLAKEKTQQDYDLARTNWKNLPDLCLVNDDTLKGVEGKTTTERVQKLLAQKSGWTLVVISYELYSRVQSKTLLQDLNFDLLMLDESHKTRNLKAAVTKHLKRWRAECPSVPMAIGSGSMTKRSIRDYAHHCKWVLGLGSPCPLREDVLEEWCFALDGSTMLANRLEPGALLAWAEGGTDTEAARRGWQKRFAETPGVVVFNVPPDHIKARIEITGETMAAPDTMVDAWTALRDRWELPDGTELVEGCEVYRHARELALGFHYKWSRPGPDPWMQARKAYGQYTREKLKTGHWDSPDEVAKAHPNAPEVTEWQAIRASFDPETTIVWLSLHALQWCADWLKAGGVVFTEHVLFGQALSFLAKVPYFGRGGLDADGRSIEYYNGKACIASLGSNTEGRNLQRFSRMLITSPVSNGLQLEQLLGREHREGQAADVVEVTVLIGCYEGCQAFWQSVEDARTDTIHQNHKVLMARIDVVEVGALPRTAPFTK